jgi:uncharacterized membrane protein YoaT (DUF817 family)
MIKKILIFHVIGHGLDFFKIKFDIFQKIKFLKFFKEKY